MPSIKIYTTNTCAYCDAVKQLLDSKGQAYNVVNIDEMPEKREEMMTYTAMMTVPVVVVEDKSFDMPKVIQGWNPAKLMEAIS